MNVGGLRGTVGGTPIGRNPRELARAAEKMAKLAPADAVIFSQAPLCYSMGPRAAYTLYELEAFNRSQGLARFRDTDRRSHETEPRRQPRWRSRSWARGSR